MAREGSEQDRGGLTPRRLPTINEGKVEVSSIPAPEECRDEVAQIYADDVHSFGNPLAG